MANDTSIEAQRRWVKLLQSKTPEERARVLLQRIEAMRRMRAHTAHLRPEPSDGVRRSS